MEVKILEWIFIKKFIVGEKERIYGNYITVLDNTEVPVRGVIDDESLFLEFESVGKFSGTINDEGEISGDYESYNDDFNEIFSLRLDHYLGDTYETRYNGFNTEEVENFAEKTKSEIINDNIKKVGKLISYPINLYVNGVLTEIICAEEFEEHYSEIISVDFKSKIRNSYTRYLFSNFQGIMIGDGEIWFGDTEDKDGLWIIAINNWVNDKKFKFIKDIFDNFL